jgi:CRP-like cAMP-binding protein
MNLQQIAMDGKIWGNQPGRSLSLRENTLQVLELFSKGYSISEVVQFFLQKNELPSFLNLSELVRFLVEEKFIRNPQFQNYFIENVPEKEKGLFQNLIENLKAQDTHINLDEEMSHIPFLRSLNPEIRKALREHSKVIDTPSGITVCRAGDLQRGLFVLVRGQAAVYKRNAQGQKRKIAVLNDHSIFGEIGFFLGEPRAADVVTEENSLIVRFKYVPEIFDGLIQTEVARNLQKRFWLIHALLKSKVFSGIPDDCFDALIFSGDLKTIPAETVICKEGDRGNSCYIIVQGSAVVSQGKSNIKVLSQGDCFGEIALMITGGSRSATVKAQTEVLTLEIPRDRFYKLLSENLILAAEIEKVAFQRIQEEQRR